MAPLVTRLLRPDVAYLLFLLLRLLWLFLPSFDFLIRHETKSYANGINEVLRTYILMKLAAALFLRKPTHPPSHHRPTYLLAKRPATAHYLRQPARPSSARSIGTTASTRRRYYVYLHLRECTWKSSQAGILDECLTCRREEDSVIRTIRDVT